MRITTPKINTTRVKKAFLFLLKRACNLDGDMETRWLEYAVWEETWCVVERVRAGAPVYGWRITKWLN